MTAVGAPATLTGRAVVLAPATARHVPELWRILRLPEVAARWLPDDLDPAWPFDEPDVATFTVLVAGVVRGAIQYAEEPEPVYRHASLDVFLDPAVHGRGLGRDTVGTLARHLVDDLGHHRLTIDPAADNLPAIRCYAAVGFRPVGVLRQYERNADGRTFHDGLLMDLLAAELVRP